MSKILLIVYDNDAHIGFFPMGVAALAAYVRRAGHEVDLYSQDIHHYPDEHLTEYLDLYSQDIHHYPDEHLTEYLDRHYYDVVGLSFIGAYYPYQRAKRISKAINAAKDRPFFVIGGHGPSPEPEYFLRLLHADAVVMGEGEETLTELLASGPEDTPGVAYYAGDEVVVNKKRPTVGVIDSLPMPAYDLFPMDVYRLRRDSAHVPAIGNRFSIQMLSGRGCKFNCNFCYRIDEGMRLRSAEAIVDEMNCLYRNWHIQHFMFYDDLLMESEARTVELCEAFIRSGPPGMTFTCQGRLNYAFPQPLAAMARAGCAYIYYGVESFNDDMLQVMGKALTCETILCGCHNTRAAGIRFSPNIIFGNIGETREHLQNSVDFLLEWDDCAQLRAIKPVTPYPGSPLYRYAIEKGLLEGPADFYERKHTNTDLLSVNFTDMSDGEFYDVLHDANKQIAGNYCARLGLNYQKQMHQLYCNQDASFRGFRHV